MIVDSIHLDGLCRSRISFTTVFALLVRNGAGDFFVLLKTSFQGLKMVSAIGLLLPKDLGSEINLFHQLVATLSDKDILTFSDLPLKFLGNDGSVSSQLKANSSSDVSIQLPLLILFQVSYLLL